MQSKETFLKKHIIDILILLLILLFATGVLLIKTGNYKTSSNMIKKESTIEFDVITRPYELSTTKKLFKIGEKSFLTIRNVPYTQLEIVNAIKNPSTALQFNPKDPKNPVLVRDTAHPSKYTFTITLKDKAIITPQGPVVGGNKIKIGLPVDIEGYDYRFAGHVSDVRVSK